MGEVPLYTLNPKVNSDGTRQGSWPRWKRFLEIRGTSLTRKRPPLGTYTRLMHRALWSSYGVGVFL